jgi:hypothetical protein
MNYSAADLAVRPPLIFLLPRKRAASRRLPITRWETHFWTKKIIKARKLTNSKEVGRFEACSVKAL